LNGIAVRLILALLDFGDGSQNEESAGQRRKADVSEVVAQQAEQRYQGEARPLRPPAHSITQAHGLSEREPL
jgi:hypothetical protein